MCFTCFILRYTKAGLCLHKPACYQRALDSSLDPIYATAGELNHRYAYCESISGWGRDRLALIMMHLPLTGVRPRQPKFILAQNNSYVLPFPCLILAQNTSYVLPFPCLILAHNMHAYVASGSTYINAATHIRKKKQSRKKGGLKHTSSSV